MQSRRIFPAILAAFFSAFASFCAISGFAAEQDALLEKSRKIEAGAMSLLAGHYRFEEALLAPDNDRLTVFISVPHGARVIIDKVTLILDGKPVIAYPYSGVELLKFQQRSIQLLYVGRIPTGEHTLRLDVNVMQGGVAAMKDYPFVKEDEAKVVELQIAGYQMREVVVAEW